MQSVGCGQLDPPASLFRNRFPSSGRIGTLKISRLCGRSAPRAEYRQLGTSDITRFLNRSKASAAPDREVARDHFRLPEQRFVAEGGAPGRFAVVESKSEITAAAQSYFRGQLHR
jgi:hypothetical protein